MVNSSLATLEQIPNALDTWLSAASSSEVPKADQIVLDELQRALCVTSLRRVYFADRSSAPPPAADVSHFPRIAIPLQGCHSMKLARHSRIENIRATPGEVVFVPGNAWNKPDWSTAARVANIVFATDHMNITVIDHDGKSSTPAADLQTSIEKSSDGTTRLLLDALAVHASENEGAPLARLITESLLHSCLRQQSKPPAQRRRKAAQTYHALCCYLQREFHSPVTRETVAVRFGLAPNHISRLFRQEGFLCFVDYLNMVRISQARNLLRESNMPLKAIATACGYQDTAYFCRVFKRTCKLTPTDFRAQAGC